MNFIRLLAKPETENTVIVYWTNSIRSMKGAIRVKYDKPKDNKVVAELYAMQYLLEVKEVIGHNTAGNTTTELIFSIGEINKLAQKTSEKPYLAEYALFLTTRFKECPIKIEQLEGWIDTTVAASVELDANDPMEERIPFNGLGEILISSHAVESYHSRFVIPHFNRGLSDMLLHAEKMHDIKLDKETHLKLEATVDQDKHPYTVAYSTKELLDMVETKLGKLPKQPTHGDSWRKLMDVASNKGVQEFTKDNSLTRIRYAIEGHGEGRYFIHRVKGIVMVVGKNKRKQTILLTTYPTVSS